jgi:NADPH:quinone reductase-like Zn-dependent oxidoreductase
MPKVAAGQWFAVMGATGGVGGYSLQLAHARGAHVIATVHRATNEAVRLGAEEAYDSLDVDVIDAIKQKHPDGVDAVLDVVKGSEAIRREAEILKPGGRLVSTLYAADIPWFAERRITAENIASVENPFASREGLTELAHFLATGAITTRRDHRVTCKRRRVTRSTPPRRRPRQGDHPYLTSTSAHETEGPFMEQSGRATTGE